MTWQTDVFAALATGRPMEAFLSVANVTARPMTVRVRLMTSLGRSRTETQTLNAGETWSAKVRALFGSQGTDLAALLAGLVVTCDGGATACPASLTLLTAPTCTVVTP